MKLKKKKDNLKWYLLSSTIIKRLNLKHEQTATVRFADKITYAHKKYVNLCSLKSVRYTTVGCCA